MFNKSLWVIENNIIQENLMKYTNNIRNYNKNTFIYQQEDIREYLYFLIKGRIRVSISSPNGSEKTLAIHEPGSFFGETAFFDHHPSFSYAQSLSDSTVLIFSKEQIITLMKEQPEIFSHILESMSRKIRLLSFQVECLSFMKIEERLVALLITLFASAGVECSNTSTSTKMINNCKSLCPHGYLLELTITDQEIGDMVGVRREAVTKAINKLKNQGLIYKYRRTICCPDLSKLNDILSNKD